MTDTTAAPATSTAIEVATAAELAALMPAGSYDGYSEAIPKDRIKLPRRIFNKTGQDVAGIRFGVDNFYDTVTQTATETIDCIFAYIKFSRAWTQYDDAEERTEYICSSSDGVMGALEANGSVRPCKGCPDAKWHRNDKGKRSVNCAEIYNVLAKDLATSEPFMIKFQKSSASALTDHIAKHHNGKLRVSGVVQNVPLFAYHVRLGLKLAANGKYAVPTIAVLGMSTRPEALECLEVATAMRASIDEAVAEKDSDAGGDTSFDTEDLAR